MHTNEMNVQIHTKVICNAMNVCCSCMIFSLSTWKNISSITFSINYAVCAYLSQSDWNIRERQSKKDNRRKYWGQKIKLFSSIYSTRNENTNIKWIKWEFSCGLSPSIIQAEDRKTKRFYSIDEKTFFNQIACVCLLSLLEVPTILQLDFNKNLFSLLDFWLTIKCVFSLVSFGYRLKHTKCIKLKQDLTSSIQSNCSCYFSLFHWMCVRLQVSAQWINKKRIKKTNQFKSSPSKNSSENITIEHTNYQNILRTGGTHSNRLQPK